MSDIGKSAGKIPEGLGIGLKAGLIAILILVFGIPIQLIKGLVSERQGIMEEARGEISDKAGGESVLGIVYLRVPSLSTVESLDDSGRLIRKRIKQDIIFMPRNLQIEAHAKAEIRKRGIHQVPVYRAAVEIHTDFTASLQEAGLTNPQALWDEARLCLELADPRSIAELPRAASGEESLQLRSDQASLGFLKRGLSAAIPLKTSANGRMEAQASISLSLNGAQSIRFLPSGENTQVKLSGDWPSPSFYGYRLPNDRKLGPEGFSASYFSDDSSQALPAAFVAGSVNIHEARDYLFGMAFHVPVDVYLQTHRALRYAILFILIPFAALFLLEVILKRRIHPLQYLFIGLADSIFYLLLLSLCEHIPFGAAFIVAASAVSALLTIYASAALGDKRKAFFILPALAAQYAYLYCALESQDYALLIGALGLFFLIAATMIGTRKINWYSPMAKAGRAEAIRRANPDEGRLPEEEKPS